MLIILKRIFLIAILFCNSSLYGQSDTLKYIFMGHTYGYHDPNHLLDSRIDLLDFDEYDGIWLGGDISSEALMEYATLEVIHNAFNLKDPNTHWALGNHDARNGNWIWLEELIGRKTYYSSSSNGITNIILNTNLTPYHCEQLNEQHQIIVDVCDTISKSTHLILLMHHGIWEGVPGLISPIGYAQSNLRFYNFNCYDVESNFVNEIYPRLLEVKNRGIEVICIMGDIGAVKVDFMSDDGVHFLGAGLQKSYYQDQEERKNSRTDYVIVFKHVPETGWLDWEHVDFDELSGYQY